MDPTIDYNRVAQLPALVRSLCHSHEGWVVGSAARYLLGLSDIQPRDYDVLVPFYTWGVACRCIPEGTPTNSHGGVKLVSDGVAIDLWAGDIGWFLGQVPECPSYAVQPRSMTFLTAERRQRRVKSAPPLNLNQPLSDITIGGNHVRLAD